MQSVLCGWGAAGGSRVVLVEPSLVGRTVVGAVPLEALLFCNTSSLTFAVVCRLQLDPLVWKCGDSMQEYAEKTRGLPASPEGMSLIRSAAPLAVRGAVSTLSLHATPRHVLATQNLPACLLICPACAAVSPAH